MMVDNYEEYTRQKQEIERTAKDSKEYQERIKELAIRLDI